VAKKPPVSPLFRAREPSPRFRHLRISVDLGQLFPLELT
jgi:hypothetical protein